MAQIRRRALFFICIILLGSFFFEACSKRPAKDETAPIFGIDPIPAASDTAGYRGVLAAWKRAGFRNMTVVSMGPKDGLAFIPPDRMKAIRSSLNNGAGAAGDDGMVTADNYLYAAHDLGLISRVVWVIPFGYADYIDAEARIRNFLKNEASYFSPKDIDSISYNKGVVSGRLFGIETYICSPSRIMFIRKPALVTLDTGFFPAYSARKGINKLGGMRDFFELMSAWRIAARSVFVISSPDLKAMHGYLAEQALAIVNNPGIVRTGAPPALWLVRDQAENMFSGGGIKEAVSYLIPMVKKYPADPYLTLILETGRVLLSEKPASSKELERLCRDKPDLCRGMVDAGVALRDKGDGPDALEFFRRALALKPDLRSARMEIAATLYGMARYEEAARELDLSSADASSVTGLFLRGDCAYALRHEDEARADYEKAVAAYREAGSYRLGARELAGVNRLRSIYERQGDKKGLNRLDKLALH